MTTTLSRFVQDIGALQMATLAITIAPFRGQDSYAQASYGAAVTYQARLSGPVKYFHRETLQTRISKQTVDVFSADVFSTRDQITLPTVYDAATPTPHIEQIDRITDNEGVTFSVLHLG